MLSGFCAFQTAVQKSSAIFRGLIGFISADQEIFPLWGLRLFRAMRVPLRNPEQKAMLKNRGHGGRTEISKLNEIS
jgi:hypothetical protein